MRAKRHAENGFTLLEITFVIAIFAVMATIVLFQFRTFGTQVTLDSLSQDIALRITSAQNAAISGTGNINVSTLGVVPNYGMYFYTNTTPSATSKTFTYFTDTSTTGTRMYNGSACTSTPTPGVECLANTTINTGDYISDICWNTGGGSTVYPCASSTPASPIATASITYTRPFPNATIKICATTSLCAPTSAINAQTAYIQITSGTDPTIKRTIIVTALGQVRIYPGPASLAHP